MNDKELIRKFESGQVPAAEFHHSDHVRLAFAYLNCFSTLDALDRFSSALKRFAITQGKAERYNQTITYAYFFLIHERAARRVYSGWDEFAAQNHDLLKWKDGLLTRYYSQPTLDSDLARRVFLFPDKF